mmetsp:Transcript_17670/g.27358  ORF Transcript_17670/g.27358 Transcript_17670/m.27358 type:complete len:120 (+) Transcript_17670:1104-1463(+)
MNLQETPRQALQSPKMRKKTGDVDAFRQPDDLSIPTLDEDPNTDRNDFDNSRSYLKDEDLEFADANATVFQGPSLKLPSKMLDDSNPSPHHSETNDDLKLVVASSERGGAIVSRDMEWV